MPSTQSSQRWVAKVEPPRRDAHPEPARASNTVSGSSTMFTRTHGKAQKTLLARRFCANDLTCE